MMYSTTGHAGEQGFTLLELLVSIALAMVVLAAGYTVFEGSNRAVTQQNMENRMQDNARMAMDVLARNFRRAGFLANFGSYHNSWRVDGATVRLVSHNSNTGPDKVEIIGGALIPLGKLHTPVPSGADQLIVSGDLSGVEVGDIIAVGLTFSSRVRQAPTGSVIDLDASVPTGATNMPYPGEFLEDGVTRSKQHPAPVRLLTKVTYLIDESDQNHPVLKQKMKNAPEEPVAEDIEDFQIRYGVDANKNRIIENNEWRDNPADAELDLIRLVRITIVARSAQKDPALIGRTQVIPKIEDHPTRQVTDGYRRYILSRVVKARNLDVLFTL